MKTRNGFVSNSSSSSFIVIQKDFLDKKAHLNKKEESVLIKFGFKKVLCCFPDQVPNELYANKEERATIEKEIKERYNYGYDVTCNQDDIIYFLLKNNISFSAACHYNHYNVFYVKDDPNFLEIQNYGQQATMLIKRDTLKGYNEITGEFGLDTKNPVRKVNVKKWLKEQKSLQKEFEEAMSKDVEEIKLDK